MTLAFFRVKLCAKHIAALYGGGHRYPIGARADGGFSIGIKIIAVDKVKQGRVGDIIKQDAVSGLLKIIPAHVRDTKFFVTGRDALDLTGYPAEASMIAKFLTAFAEQLKTQADPQNGFFLDHDHIGQWFGEATFVKIFYAIAECPDTGQDELISLGKDLRVAADLSLKAEFIYRSQNGTQITEPIVDNTNHKTRKLRYRAFSVG